MEDQGPASPTLLPHWWPAFLARKTISPSGCGLSLLCLREATVQMPREKPRAQRVGQDRGDPEEGGQGLCQDHGAKGMHRIPPRSYQTGPDTISTGSRSSKYLPNSPNVSRS